MRCAWVVVLGMLASTGCGGGSRTPDPDAGPDGGGCPTGTQDLDGDGICNPDCASTSCGAGTCAVDLATGLAECTCDPGFVGPACDALDVPATTGLLFWLDAADATTYDTDVVTDAFTSWTDKVGALTSTIDDAPEAPVLVDDAWNGLPVAHFDGVDDGIYWTGFDGLDSDAVGGQAEYTIFVVVDAANPDETIFEAIGTVEDQLLVGTSVGGIDFTHDPGTPSALTYAAGAYASSAFSWGDPHILTIQKKALELSIWIDGSYRISTPAANTDALQEQLTVTLGRASGANVLQGDIGELIIAAGALDYPERKAIEDYLGAKWFGEAFPRNPTTFGTTTVWLDASRSSSITEAGGTVNAWSNLGVDGGFFSNGGFADARPTRVPAALNGLDVVHFDGSDAIVQNGIATYDSVYLGGTSNAYTMVAIVVPPATGGTNTVFAARSGGDLGLRYDILPSAPGVQYVHRWPADTIGGDLFSPTFTVDTARFFQVARAAESYTFTVDGATETLSGSVAPTMNIGGGESLDWMIGGESLDAPTEGLEGDLAELIFMHAALSSAERVALRQMLEAKWGL